MEGSPDTEQDYSTEERPIVRLEDGSLLSREEVQSLIRDLEDSLDSDGCGDRPAGVLRATREVRVSFRGPIPPADVLDGYERVCPGAADRVIAMAERQSEHRMEMDRKVLEANVEADSDDRAKEYRLSVLGSVFSCVIAVSLVVCGTICLVLEKNVAGFASIGIALTSIGGVSFFNWRKASSPKPAESTREKSLSKDKKARVDNDSAGGSERNQT